MRIDPLPVTSTEDPRVGPYTRLTDMDLRLRSEPAGGYFMAEGHLVIQRCADLGLHFLSVLTSPRWIDRLAPLLAGTDVVVYTAEESLLQEITGFRVHRGAMAAVRRPPELQVHEVLAEPGDVLVLEDLVDPTNVGLAIRSAVVQGIDRVVLSPGCADPLYRRAVKASMGTVLRTRWARSTDWPRTLAEIAGGRRLAALTPEGADSLGIALRGTGAVAIMLGSEGPGLSQAALAAAQSRCAIPMASAGDSLNVAAATAIACFVRAGARTMAP